MNKFKNTLDVLKYISKEFNTSLDYHNINGCWYARFEKFNIFCVECDIKTNTKFPDWFINQMQDIHIEWPANRSSPTATMHEQINSKLLVKGVINNLLACASYRDFVDVVNSFGDNTLRYRTEAPEYNSNMSFITNRKIL